MQECDAAIAIPGQKKEKLDVDETVDTLQEADMEMPNAIGSF